MHIDHVAIWTNQLDVMRDFYETYFEARRSNIYHNPDSGLETYFLYFSSGARLELMQIPGIDDSGNLPGDIRTGFAHISFACGSESKVDLLTKRLQENAYTLLNGPRKTGDGYYESLVLDPDGNQIEITV
jgi:lactoylglutathione lyase